MLLCLLPTVEAAEELRQYVYPRLPQRKNRPKAFGHQYVMNEKDEILEEEPHPKYYLSTKACQGILNRAAKRGKDLPKELKEALIQQANVIETLA